MTAPSKNNSAKVRNLTKIKFAAQGSSHSAPSTPHETPYDPPNPPASENMDDYDEPSNVHEAASSKAPPQFRHSIFYRPKKAEKEVVESPPERDSGDYFDMMPTVSEAGSRPETPFDVNLEDPGQGLLNLKPPPPMRDRTGAEALKRKTRAMSVAYIEYAQNAMNSLRKNRNQPDALVPEQKYQKVTREGNGWFSNWSTRRVILVSASAIIMVLLAVGLTLGLLQRGRGTKQYTNWRPAVGTTWQIQLNSPVTDPSLRAYIYDVDYFDANASTIANLHSLGRRVLCHFSAGTYETWQPDPDHFPPEVIGGSVIGWGIEHWLDIRADSVRKVMANRITQAQKMGCDGIVPDNVNVYSIENSGFNITESDGTKFVRYMAGLAHPAGLSIGLANSPEIVNSTIDVVDFGFNEACVANNNCEAYHPFIQAGKPVLHIEYTSGVLADDLTKACTAADTYSFSTLLKDPKLDAWAMDCPLNSS
ncbi:hypothetical protein BP6252_09549 [Coleophoma cylindrospora]|uniref:alpha-galactosidase n=1 Tax=Coleophoma cylindrospora TaxID=1849047 RepID=A0A3D8R285_9HELO|nr:hypothetical protein BP6252_09549 [Coleophoma cylindrospora]